MPPEGEGVRSRCIVGELNLQPNGEVHLRYLTGTPEFEKARNQGFRGHAAFKISQECHLQGVMQTFMLRLPPSSREDYTAYLTGFCIPHNADLSEFALLGYTGARLPSDGFGIIHTFDGVDGPCEFLTDVAGVRYYFNAEETQNLPLGAYVELQCEPNNTNDPGAVMVLYDGKKMGYIKRGLTDAFRRWMELGHVTATIERLNGNPKRPMVLLFVRVLPASVPAVA